MTFEDALNQTVNASIPDLFDVVIARALNQAAKGETDADAWVELAAQMNRMVAISRESGGVL